VQIDRNAERIALRYPVESALVGDSRVTLDALLPLLERNTDRSFLQQAQTGMTKWRGLMLTQATDRSVPMKPQVVAHELGIRLPDNAIVSTDSGTITTWWARHFPAKEGQMYSCSGNLATMACGLPYAIAAQLVFPERPVFAFLGDGGFTMLMGELATCVKYKLPLRIVVVKNNSLAQIKWEQMVFLGNPEYVCDLQPIDFAAAARAFGMTGWVIDDPASCGSVLDQALAVQGPVLIEAIVDPNTPPMPARVTPEQALHLTEALVRGTKGGVDIIKDIAGAKIRQLV
jgi:pyruvate dehydrogenase (quinone)